MLINVIRLLVPRYQLTSRLPTLKYKNKTVSIHQKNLQVLVTEIFKEKVNISPKILKELFSFNVTLKANRH